MSQQQENRIGHIGNGRDTPASASLADDPDRLAKLIKAKESNLVFFRGDFFRWSGACYELVPDGEMELDIADKIETEFASLETPGEKLKITLSLIKIVTIMLKKECRINSASSPPFFIDDPGRDCRDFIVLQNGILDLKKLTHGDDGFLIPPTPKFFATSCLPVSFDASATCSVWSEFLSRNLQGDPERIAILQEIFGYALTTRRDLQKFATFIGSGANGKSVACAALTALLGKFNVSNLPLEAFGGKFDLHKTIGKLANISADVGTITGVAEGTIKAFASGDRITMDRKFRDPIEAEPTALLVLATNAMPKIMDRSEGFWRRVLLVLFDVTIPKDERIPGMDKIEFWQDELPGLLNWALVGLIRLRQQKQFTTSKLCEDALENHKLDAFPARRFLTENFAKAANGIILTDELFRRYTAWCSANGIRPLPNNKFGSEVHSTFPEVRNGRASTGKRARIYRGMRPISSMEDAREPNHAE